MLGIVLRTRFLFILFTYSSLIIINLYFKYDAYVSVEYYPIKCIPFTSCRVSTAFVFKIRTDRFFFHSTKICLHNYENG